MAVCKRCGEDIATFCTYCLNHFLRELKAKNLHLEAENNKFKFRLNEAEKLLYAVNLSSSCNLECTLRKEIDAFLKRSLNWGDL